MPMHPRPWPETVNPPSEIVFVIANPLAIALSPLYEPGVNVLRVAFLDHAVQDLYDPASTSEQALSLLASIADDRTDTAVGKVNAI
jgi:hypothetical protein